jgi:hypothetical protein
MSSVSQHLEQQLGVKIRPGGKGLCPFCRKDTFSVKRDDSVGKCFHPKCGRAITAGSLSAGYAGSLYEVLDKIKEDCHNYLLGLPKTRDSYAWEYLTRQRGIHQAVLTDLPEIGAVPPGYDVAGAFKPALDAISAREAELVAKIDEALQRRVEAKEAREEAHQKGRQKTPPTAKSKTEIEKAWEQELQRLRGNSQFLGQKRDELRERLAKVAKWVAFFHTDARHRVRSIRFRHPGDKRFQSWVPFKDDNGPAKDGYPGGCFGHSLFRQYQSAEKRPQNRLVIVEGEINLLQVHSLIVRTARTEANGQGVAYANCIAAVGSSSTVDIGTIKGLLATPGAVGPPVVIQDHDDAGGAMVTRLSNEMTVEVVKPPKEGQDIDDFIRGFGSRVNEALAAFRELLNARRVVLRPFCSLAEQIFRTRQKNGKDDVRRDFEIHASVRNVIVKDMLDRGTFYHDHRQGYYFWGENKRLIALDDHDKELSLLLDKYGLNATEKPHSYMAEALHVESLERGAPTRVHRFTWFDRDAFTLYLYNHASGVYRITADGVELVDNGTDGVLFLYDRRNEPFSLAEDAASCEGLFHEAITSKINFATDGRLTVDDQQAVFNFWLLSTFFGTLLPTRPLLAFIGPKGSGKSHTLRKIGVLQFGPRFEVKNLPDKEDAFDAVTTNTHFAAFDNADSKVDWLPDRLAICATGGSVPKRVLYTTNTLIDFPITCFVGITSRTPHFQRDDVADRLLIHRVRRFNDGEFISEEELLRAVVENRDRIMTDIVQQLQDAIKALWATAGRSYKTAFRMADWATFALRLADAEGTRAPTEALFAKLCAEQDAFTLEGECLVDVLSYWLDVKTNPGREVDAATLFEELKSLAAMNKLKWTYTSPRSLAQRLRNVLHNLKAAFRVEVVPDKHNKQQKYKFNRLAA